jgi:molybdopterin molybdotransferase
MLDFETARERLLRDAPTLGAMRVPLSAALGRVLAEDLIAREPIPPFDTSAMDGYALRSEQLSGSPPWTFPVEGESQTGHMPSDLRQGAVTRIFTGAVVPAGADTVEMQENVERREDNATFAKPCRSGNNIRSQGEDLAVGQSALPAGTRLGPYQIGLAASLDRPYLTVARPPRVTIVCTGDELRNPGEPARPGSIPESNGVALACLAQQAGADALLAPLTGDDLDATAAALEAALATSDLLITVGGVSVGDHDVVRPALEAIGVSLDFWKVRIKPGKPLAFGRHGARRVLGLPGNPVSAQLTFALFGLPLLRAMQGDARALPQAQPATLTHSLKKTTGRMHFIRSVREGDSVTPLGNQSSGAPTGLAWANALIVAPVECEGYEAGETVSVLDLADL